MKWIKWIVALGLTAVLAIAGYVLLVVLPGLPELDKITDYQPKIPLRIYTAEGALMAEFGEEHRDFVSIDKIPQKVKQALLASEDSRFYEHSGVDVRSIGRALLSDLRGGYYQGGSTITMQVARNFFLSREKTLHRKLREILLTYKIEQTLSKDQILELYMNHIYLGQRAYGFSTAAKTYFGKSLDQLSLAEAALLIGIPRNPNKLNPVVNFDKAKAYQLLVLKAMHKKAWINDAELERASHEKLVVKSKLSFEVHADYVAEMVRQQIYADYKEQTYTLGLNVYTTIRQAEQEAAWQALRKQVLAYDARHGYRGAEAWYELPKEKEEQEQAIDEILRDHPDNGDLLAAVVKSVSKQKIVAELANGDDAIIQGEALKWLASHLNSTKDKGKLREDSVIRVRKDEQQRWQVTQVPEVEAAYVALNAEDGAYRALVGGFDFNQKKFNRVTSAWRQPGSSIKPFLYSLALERGFYPGTQVNDVQLSSTSASELKWDPRNDDAKYDGPVSLRRALAQSKNVVAARVLQANGVDLFRNWLPRFGFIKDKQPANLTLSLGTGATTPLQLAGAYAIFANGGYQVKPWVISKITDSKGKVLSEFKPPESAREEDRVIDARNAFIIDSMLREVTRNGTGAAASVKLQRNDLAGKTGTTSDAVDGWFAGYAGGIVAVSWMGYDDPRSLGGREFGATLALPIWIVSMRVSLHGKPIQVRNAPDGVVQIEGDWSYAEYAEGALVTSLDFPEVGLRRLADQSKPETNSSQPDS